MNRPTPALSALLLAALALLLAACSTNSQLITGTARAPIDPAQVRVYYNPPPGGYEVSRPIRPLR